MWVSGSARVSVFYPRGSSSNVVARGTGGQFDDSIALSDFTVLLDSASRVEGRSALLVSLVWIAKSQPTVRAWPAGMALARLLGDALFRGLAGTAFPDLAAVTRTESGQEHGVWASAYAGAYLPGWLGLPMLGGLGFREERELLLSPCRAGQPFASAQLARPWSIVAGLYLLAAAALDRCALRSGPSA
jgi:hypothetical protein